jgi:hypothetical protein
LEIQVGRGQPTISLKKKCNLKRFESLEIGQNLERGWMFRKRLQLKERPQLRERSWTKIGKIKCKTKINGVKQIHFKYMERGHNLEINDERGK